jgi:hypothetical protein
MCTQILFLNALLRSNLASADGFSFMGGWAMTARKRSQSVGRSRRSKARRHTRLIGLGTSASAFLALGLGPLAAAPAAHADDFGLDNILEPIITSMTNIDPALSVGLDHWAASLDAALSSFSSADPTPGLDSTLAAAWSTETLGSFSSADPTTGLDSPLAAASSTDTSSPFLQELQQDWINSNFGSHVDHVLNSWYLEHANPAAAGDSCGMICNGTPGTAADPNGGDGGTVFGNGGAGYTYTSTSDPTGAPMDGGNGGDALGHGNGGAGGDGFDGGNGGDGGAGGLTHGNGGNGGDGSNGSATYEPGKGGNGGDALAGPAVAAMAAAAVTATRAPPAPSPTAATA